MPYATDLDFLTLGTEAPHYHAGDAQVRPYVRPGSVLSYHTFRRPQALMESPYMPGLDGLYEVRQLDKIPQEVVRIFAAHSKDPEVVEYLTETLRADDPFGTILKDMEATGEEYSGLAGLAYLEWSGADAEGLAGLGAVPLTSQVPTLQQEWLKRIKAAPSKDKFRLLREMKTDLKKKAQEEKAAYNKKWYGGPIKPSDFWTPGYKLKDFPSWKWFIQYIQKHGKDSVPEPSLDEPGAKGATGRSKGSAHASWMEAQFRVFGPTRFPQPPAGTPERAEWDMAYSRSRKTGGFFGALGRGISNVFKQVGKAIGKAWEGVKKVWKRFGNIIITIAGAALAPFTGGASLAAASVLGSAKKMYDTDAAAKQARAQARADAAQIQAEADRKRAETMAQLDKFYADNTAWFLQYDMTPDKWAKLDLEHKIEFIQAGTEGRLPRGTVESQPPAGTAPPGTPATTPTFQPPTVTVDRPDAPPALRAPTYAPPGAPGVPSYGPAYAPEGTEPQPLTPGAVFEVTVEGRSVGKFDSIDAASQAAIQTTLPGERFEVFMNGKSLGLNLRTGSGAIEVPPGSADQMRRLSAADAKRVYEEAEKGRVAAAPGTPWLAYVAGGGLLIAALTGAGG